ncbi:hypothetical protein PsAD2_02963 [Pseudovibrio axinellae]|uniref:Uncharacterized protein n=1 Tax=Pseudovibrio axinellae TaxID=989403 RepID=A0A165XED2_9HYPH|nr:hypothetical protein [Pseudovibrio axinellae]KZL17627.1 hypothetical protein PsAD2_02963 [Pseudovibrio axinellae]SER45778.1 hypothetical protein SAMN05421798_110119 [Pseudovibrio axinellae]
MSTRPILFSGPMVNALLEGRKTQTRRILNRLKGYPALSDFMLSETKGFDWEFRRKDKVWCSFRHEDLLKIMPHLVGDLLYVRERFSAPAINDFIKYNIPPQHWENVALNEYGMHFWADGEPEFGDWEKPKPSIHMPRKLSRITLEVTGVRVERLQDISTPDAIAEGIEEALRPSWHHDRRWKDYSSKAEYLPHPNESFRSLWDSLNKARGFGWDANPWVSVTEFKVHECNVDEFEREAA